MRFVVYLDTERTIQPRERAPGEPVVLELDPDTRFDEAAAEAIRIAGMELRSLYYFGGSGPHYWPVALRDAGEPNPETMPFPQVVIDQTGEFLWTEGARDQVALADIKRSREAGFFDGDPGGVFLERPMFGEAPLGWEDFLQWLLQFASFLAGVGTFVDFVRRRYERWKRRGAATPYAFLDVVIAREEWDRNQLCQLLRLEEQEATELLTMLAFVADREDPNRWLVSSNPNVSGLRKKIIEDYLHRSGPQEDKGEK